MTIGQFTISGDRTKLTVNNVKREDNMCLQCVVENNSGTLFGDGCLTIIGKDFFSWFNSCHVGGWVVRRCHVSFVTRSVQLILADSWARPAILVAGKSREVMFLFLLFLHFHSCLFLPCPSLSSLLLSLLSIFSLSLGDDTKWPTRVDVSLNPNSIKTLVMLNKIRCHACF